MTEHQQLPHLTVLQKMWFISLIFFRIKIHETGLMADSSVETQRKLLGLVTFIGTLSLTFWWSGASIYPIETLASAVVFITIVLVALLLRAMAGTSLAFTVRSISVPVGLYISLLSLVQASRRCELHPGAHLPAAPKADRPRRAPHQPLPGLDRRHGPPAGLGAGGGLRGVRSEGSEDPIGAG